MELFSALGAVLLFSLACNLDTVILAMGYAAKGIHIPRGGLLIIALVTTGVTWLSLALGEAGASLLSPRLSQLLGGAALAGIGGWCLLDALRRLGQEPAEDLAASNLWGCVSLAAALAVNNGGIGVAAGVAGLDLWLAAGMNFAVTLLALPLGRALGEGWPGRLLGRYALPLSGGLLILLGLWEALG